MSKHYPKYKKIMSRLIEQEASINLMENLKNGKVGSMKAQRRLI